jgi:hypothetical protein
MSKRTTETICTEINAVQSKMESAEKRAADLRDTRKSLVLELRETHPDRWLDELKTRCQIGRSQAFKIAAIADGRTTEEREREKNAEAVRRHRAIHATSPLHLGSNGLGNAAVDLQASTDARKAAYGEASDATYPSIPKPESRKITMLLPQPAPETPEDLAAELMLLFGEVTRQYDNIDPPLVRAELIRLLSIAPDQPPARAPGNGVDVDTSAEVVKAGFAELAADLGAALSEPPKRKRGRPAGSKNKARVAASTPTVQNHDV